jgi:hypothetical protein
MTQIDQFESVFKAADKPQFLYEPIEFKNVLVITDLNDEAAASHCQQLEQLLTGLNDTVAPTYQLITGNEFSTVASLIQQVEDAKPDLICMYRNLHSPASDFPYSLGIYVDVMAQATHIPVLILPHPDSSQSAGEETDVIERVMAITNHLAGDSQLVNYAAALTPVSGCLYLSHVEDKGTFDRYVATIGKIPEIETQKAQEQILNQLLKEPREFVHSCREAFSATKLMLQIEEVVVLGHRMNDYHRLIEEHGIDLLVMNTKDEDQLAMHGLAYPLAVELRHLPLLLV